LINTLAASGFLLLLMDSQQLFQVGFQLSFVAVFAILIFVRPLSHLLFRPFETDPFLPRQMVDRAQRSAQQLARWVCDLSSVSTVCWFASLPILILAFHRVSICGLVANILAVPLGTWILLLGVASLLISPVSSWASICINNANWALTKVFLWVIQASALLPYDSVNVAFPPVQSSFMLTALSAGRASVFHLHSASDDWLINTGTESKWRHLTEPYLQASGVNRLGTIILTHNDLMRAGGAGEAARRFACNRFFIANGGQARATAPALPASELQPWPGTGSFRSSSGILISELRPIVGARLQNGRKPVAFLCRFENWRFLIAPELTLEALERLAPPPVDVAFLSRIDRNSIPRLSEKLALQAIVCERNTGDTTGVEGDGPQIPVFCLAVDGATTLSTRDGKLELRTFRGAQLTLTSRSR
jgi:ComEC/Rec2-related protein